MQPEGAGSLGEAFSQLPSQACSVSLGGLRPVGRGWEDCAEGGPRGQPHRRWHPPLCTPRVLQETHVLTGQPWSPWAQIRLRAPRPVPCDPQTRACCRVGPAPRTTGRWGAPVPAVAPGGLGAAELECAGRSAGLGGPRGRQASLPGASPHRRAEATAEGRAELRQGSAQPRRGPVLGPLPWERAQQGLIARAAGTGKEPQPQPPSLRLQRSSLGRGRPGAQSPSAVRAQARLHSGPGLLPLDGPEVLGLGG